MEETGTTGEKEQLLRDFFAAIDATSQAMKSRFDQEDLKVLREMDDCLVKTANGIGDISGADVKETLASFSHVVNLDKLTEELREISIHIKIYDKEGPKPIMKVTKVSTICDILTGKPSSKECLPEVDRYFVHGLCKAGNTCNYSHDRSSVVDNVCKYYKEGTCYYGDKCKFSHGEPGSKSQTRGNVKKIPSKCKVLPLQVQSPPKEPGRKLTPLKPGGKPKAVPFTGKDFNFEDVLDVPEFIPGQKYQGSAKIPSSYSSAVSKDRSKTDSQSSPGGERGISQRDILCPFAIKGTCRYGENCAYTHGAVCEFCNFACLYPFETEENKKHIAECISNHEVSMNESFALQQSKSIACSICMEVVLEKTNRKDQKFGILNNCTHPFCLECIRKWRSSKECEKKVVKGCPVCRVSSDFVCPSDYWVVDEEEKVTMIKKYKEALSQKACKYFSEGTGECPFGANCFYKHAYPDGTLQDRSKIRKYGNGSGKMKTHHAINLWDFLEERDLSGDDEDDFFLFGSGWEDLDSGDLEDYLLYRALFAGSDSDDDSVEDLMLGINMLGLTLVGAAAASLGRGRREGGGSGSTSNQSSSQSSGQCVNNGDEGNRGSDDSWLTG